YGYRAAVTVLVPATVPHAFSAEQPDLLVKVYKNAAPSLIAFQRRFRERRLPGTQRTLDADVVETRDGVTRGVLVLEYIDGTPLDLFLNSNPRLPADQVAALLRSFLCGLIVAAWHEGWRFWDFRAANLVVAHDGRRVVMIDTDSLSTSAPEVWDTPAVWTVRDEQEAKAFTRLP